MLWKGKPLVALYVSFFLCCSVISFAGTPPCDLQEIFSNPLRYGASFGSHVLSGNGEYLVVGAPSEGWGEFPHYFESAGAAYVFKNIGGSWVQQARLQASDPSSNYDFTNDGFGGTLAISDDGTVLFLGAIQKDATAPNPGKAYVFNRDGSTWTQEQIITGSTVNGASFSNSMALDGSTVVIAAKYDGANPSDEINLNFRRGDIYIYTYSAATETWEPEAHFIAPDSHYRQNFGVRVSYENGIAAIGARQATGTAPRTGAVYMYTRTLGTWSFTQKLTDIDGVESDWFGFVVDLDEDADTLVVGVPRDHGVETPDSGSAFIYTRDIFDDWSLHDKLVASNPRKGDNFGHRATISRDGESVLIGAPFTDESNELPNTGSAYYFTRGENSWTWEYILNSFGLDAGAGDLFGRSITIWSDDEDAKYGFISAPRTDVQEIEDSGAVYYFGLTDAACQ